MAGQGSSLRRRDAVRMVAASGGQVVADMTRSSGVMLVESAQADRKTGRLSVAGAAIDDVAVREAVEAAGYRVTA